jgi:hypothetical protein
MSFHDTYVFLLFSNFGPDLISSGVQGNHFDTALLVLILIMLLQLFACNAISELLLAHRDT